MYAIRSYYDPAFCIYTPFSQFEDFVFENLGIAGDPRSYKAEFSGYLAVALAALGTGYIASVYGLRPEPFYSYNFV